MVDLNVKSVIAARAAVRADPVIQRIVLRGSHADIRQRKVLHHLQGHGIDEIACPNR